MSKKKVTFNEKGNRKIDSNINSDEVDLNNWYNKLDFKKMAMDYKNDIYTQPEVREEYERRKTKRNRKEILDKANQDFETYKKSKNLNDQHAGKIKRRTRKKKKKGKTNRVKKNTKKKFK